jgi:hypothetical protein
LFDSAAMAPGAGSRLRTVATTRLPYSAIGRRVRPSRDTTVKNNASPSQRPETATQNVASDPAVSVAHLGGVDEMPAKLTAEDRLKPPEPVSAQSVVSVTAGDLLTIC